MNLRLPPPLLVTLLAGGLGSAADPPLKAFEVQIQRVTEATTPSVVSLVVSHNKNYPRLTKAKPGELGGYDSAPRAFDQPGLGRGFGRRFGVELQIDRLDLSLPENTADNLFGAGVVLDVEQGLVLAPYHLIDGATKVYVRGPSGKGSYANFVATDAKSDLAVLRLISAIPDLRAVQFAEVTWADGANGRKATVTKGALVVAVGYPLAAGAGAGSPSVSWGVVSNFDVRSAVPPVALDATVPRPLHTYGGLLQVDARVALGASGTAVFNLDGQLLGLGSAVAAVSGSEASGGYVIPMDTNYRRIVEALRAGREVEYGFLGVSPQPDVSGAGVRIGTVSPACPAAAAGLNPGDLITSIDGHPLRTTDDLLHRVGAALAGSEVAVEYQRFDRPGKVKVRLAKNPNALPFLATVPSPAPFGLQVEYQSVKYAGPVGGFRNQPPQSPPPGVVIRDLVPGSAAAKVFDGLRGGKSWWVITHVDGKPVATPAAYYAAVRGKSSVKLVVADAADPASGQEVDLP